MDTSGSGQTYVSMLLAERLLATGARVISVDPLDVYWGCRTVKAESGRQVDCFDTPVTGLIIISACWKAAP